MVLSLQFIIDNVEFVKENQRKRYLDDTLVDQLVENHTNLKQLNYNQVSKNTEINKISKQIGILIKNKEDPTELKTQVVKLKNEIEEIKPQINHHQENINKLLGRIANILDINVPISNDETHNKIIKQTDIKITTGKEHFELFDLIKGCDTKRGVKVAGDRGYFLTGVGAQLNMALLNYATNFLIKRKFTLLQTPLFMNPDLMAKTAQLEDFDDQLYKVDNKYLIATSEQPISGYHADEFISELPLYYAGISSCFRKEVSSGGRDVRGTFRVHHFEKVEMFVICDNKSSSGIHEEITGIAEEFLESLGIDYRRVEIVSGALNYAAVKKYDVEGWFPGYEGYRELISSSNCGDYQSRDLNIKYGGNNYVHMLNSTLCANTRVLCCILENYQTETGVVVPEVLRPYINMEFIPFKN